MPVVYGLTGTPGSGKKSIARALARRTHWKVLHLNTLAVKGHAVIGRDAHGYVADPQRLRQILRIHLKVGTTVVVGHLLPWILRRSEAQLVAILRCSPEELAERLRKRSYPPEKVKENVQAEILDIPLYEAVRTFGRLKTAEFDTTDKKPDQVAREILDTIRGRRSRKLGIVDWLSSLELQGRLAQYLD